MFPYDGVMVYFYAQLIHHIVSDWKSCMSPYPNKAVHNMMTSSNVNISALLALCEVNPPVTAGFSSQRPVTLGFNIFFDQRLNKRLSKHSRRRWFETPSRSLWRHCNDPPVIYVCNDHICRADFSLAPSQWETSLQSKAVSHWLGANLKSALYTYSQGYFTVTRSNYMTVWLP